MFNEIPLDQSWQKVLESELGADLIRSLEIFIQKERQSYSIFPPAPLTFSAFNLTPFENVKAVIIGQDPYHGPGQAHGLAFSVQDNVKIPPSLKNIFKELESDLSIPPARTGNLEKWAQQGVLLLNTTLTVREKSPASHFNKGWEIFTDHVIEILSSKKKNLVFILWGKHAQEKEKLIDPNKGHLILKSAHPSFFSAKAFFGCRHFSKTNDFLLKTGQSPINWDLNS